MPVSRVTTEGLAQGVADVYANAEVRLLQLIAKRLARGSEVPEWAEDKLAELQRFRREAEAVMAGVRREAVGELVTAMERAYLRGTAAAQGEVDALGITVGARPTQAQLAIQRLVSSQLETLDTIGLRVVRSASDLYRQAVTRAVSGTLTGAATRLQDAQAALTELAGRGVSAFTDAAGRQWSLPTYVEMATRTTTAQAAVLGHLDRLDQAGIPLVIVSDSPNECELCAPWEGKVLARGPVSALMPNALTGDMEAVQIDGTVDDAIAAGLFHPNCTHNLSGYVHGVTKRGMAETNPQGYTDRQQQRALERRARTAKRQQAVAMTPEARARADARVATVNGQLAEHSAATGQPRKRNRESPGKAR